MEHWDYYWENSKSLHSFAESHSLMNYENAVSEYWENVFKQFRYDAYILDVATGNGALVNALVHYSDKSGLKVNAFASDLASINPIKTFNDNSEAFNLLKKIRFYPNTATEKLPFASNSFDGVISQFGFEYAKTTQALNEVLRILKPQGVFSAIIHHEESVLTQDCHSGIRFYERIDKANFFDLAIDLLSSYLPTELSYEDRESLKWKNQELFSLAIEIDKQCSNTVEEFWCKNFLKRISPLFIQPQATYLKLLRDFHKDIQHHKKRLHEQIDSAWCLRDVIDFTTYTSKLRHNVSITPFYLNADLFGWSLKLTKVY